MEFKKCTVCLVLALAYSFMEVYETYIYLQILHTFFSVFSFHQMNFDFSKSQFQSWIPIPLLTGGNRTLPVLEQCSHGRGKQNHPHIQCCNMSHVLTEEKTPSKLRNWTKNIHGWFFHTVLLHTTCHPTKRIVFQHLHCYDGDAAHKWQRLTKRANGVFMSCNEKPPFSIGTMR